MIESLFDDVEQKRKPPGSYGGLRPYQDECVYGICDAFQEDTSTLAVMATGLGKTYTACEVIRHYMRTGRVMFIAPFDALIWQTEKAVRNSLKIHPEIEKAEHWADQGAKKSPVVIASIQTLIAGMGGQGRMTRFNPHDFSLVIADEAHFCVSGSWQQVFKWFRVNDDLKILGLTATPNRHDEIALGRVFDSVAFKYETLQAINDGWLVKPHARRYFVEDLDFSGIDVRKGDFATNQLDAMMRAEGPAHKVVDTTMQEAADKRCIVFGSSVQHAVDMCEIFKRHEPGKAAVIHAKTPKEDRRRYFKQFEDREILRLCNFGTLVYGFDAPWADVLVNARPTKSLPLFQQILGRGLRTWPGTVDGLDEVGERLSAIEASPKPFLKVIDFTGVVGRHKLVGVEDALGGDYDTEVLARVAKRVEEEDTDKPVQQLLEEESEKWAEELKAKREAEEKKKRHIKGRAKFSSEPVDVFALYGTSPVKTRGWDQERFASDKQVAAIHKMTKGKVDATGWPIKQASQLLGKLIGNAKAGKASFGQVKVLTQFDLPTDVSMSTASKLIDSLSDGGNKRWSRPPQEVVDTIMENEG